MTEFKPTDLGDLPAEWEVVKFPNCILNKSIVVGKVKTNQYQATGRFPIIDQSQNYIAGYHDDEELAYKGNLPIIIFGDHTRVFKYVDFPFICGADGVKVLLPNEDLVHPQFFYYILSNLSIPSKGYNRHFTLLREQRLPLPPLDEQRKIAHVLNTVQQAIAAQVDVIVAAQELKRSLLRRLFTYGPGPEPAPTKETDIGEVPAHWEVVRLGKVAKIGNGSTPKRTNPAYWKDGTIPWLTSGKVHERIIQHADEFVTELAKQECHLPVVPKGSIVVAITGQGKTLGNAALVTFDTCVNQHLAYVQFRDTCIVPEFALAFLQQRYKDLRQASHAGGSTKGALTCGFLMNYLIPQPPVHEQHQIAHILQTADAKIAAEQDRLAGLQALFNSLLQALMTGKLRVRANG